MLVRDDDDLRHRPIKIDPIPNSEIEEQAIEVYLAHDKVRILHIYNPVGTLNIEHLDKLVDILGQKFLL